MTPVQAKEAAERVISALRRFPLLNTELNWYQRAEPEMYVKIRAAVVDSLVMREESLFPCCCECGSMILRALWPDHQCPTCSKPLCQNTNCRDKHREEHSGNR